jgi:hypothetical protein
MGDIVSCSLIVADPAALGHDLRDIEPAFGFPSIVQR